MASFCFTCFLLIVSVQVFSTGAQCPSDLTATGTMQTVLSPNYPNMYPKSTNCGFKITASAGQRVHIESVDMHLYDDNCKDKIEFFNGATDASPLASTFCGMDMVMFQSSGQDLFVKFTSDVNREGKGFALKYWSAPVFDASCNGVNNIGMTPVFLEFPNDLTSGNCKYDLTAGDNQMIFLDLVKWDMPEAFACGTGSIKITDGVAGAATVMLDHCGMERPFWNLGSKSKTLSIDIKTTFTGTPKKFYIKAKAMNTNVPSCDDVSSMRIGPMSTYLWYPLFTSGGVSCSKTLLAPGTTARVAVVNQDCAAALPFSMSEGGASKTTTCMGGKQVYSSSTQDLILSPTTGGAVLLKVASFGNNCGKDGVAKTLMAPTNTSVMEMEMKYIQKDTHCLHKIMAGGANDHVVLVLSSTLADDNDCVEVHGAMNYMGAMKKCGSFESMKFTSMGREISFKVMTNDKDVRGKLLIQYSSVHKDHVCKRYENLRATRTKKTLMTPNFPNEYPLNTVCGWRFVSYRSDYVVVIEVEESDLPDDCSDMGFVNDGELESNDRLGEWCGKRKPMYRGTGQTLLLTFDADHMMKGNKGFKFIYYADHAEAREIVSGTDVATIAAVFTIIVVAGGLIFIIYRLCTRGKEKRKARESDRQPIAQ